ncbi:MAG: 50S ribosomal protein L23 [Armatimonadota bacterium]|nr:50S ribosomal protein L23 [bacterium]
MKDAYSIIKRPLITEKGMGASAMGKYVFEVDINANKIEIAGAVKTIFPAVDVVKVNTLRVKGKTKRMGRMPQGKTADWKKAYVTLKPGQHIEIFEGA